MTQPVEPRHTPHIDLVEAPIAMTTAVEVPVAAETSIVVRLLGVLKREPVLFVTIAYVFVSILGLWSNYWFFRSFNIPILQYLQSSDFFVAGLRRPALFLILGVSLIWLWLSAWPMRWVERNVERAAEYRRKHWWGKFFFPDSRSWLTFWGVRSETMLLGSFLLLAIYLVYSHSATSAAAILKGKDKGHLVRIRLSTGETLPADTTLLGTTSAFVFLWGPASNHVEIVPIESISRIESIDAPSLPPTLQRPAPATKVPQ
jgi:hypothetical protein